MGFAHESVIGTLGKVEEVQVNVGETQWSTLRRCKIGWGESGEEKYAVSPITTFRAVERTLFV